VTRSQAVTASRTPTVTFIPPIFPQPCVPIAQAFCLSQRDPASYTSVAIMNGACVGGGLNGLHFPPC
jgi:hypothetical protein